MRVLALTGSPLDAMAANYAQVVRLALALQGREDVARAIVASVLHDYQVTADRRQLDDDSPRWFRHHTVLTSRRPRSHAPDLARDALVSGEPAPSQWYPPFVGAIRALSGQQREAMLLRFGENLDLRGIATAMDCSTTAAQMHLDAALGALREYAGPLLEGLVGEMAQHYQALTPADAAVFPAVRQAIRRHWWPRLVRRVLVLLLAAGVAVVVVWSFDRIWPTVRHLLRR